MDRISNLLSGEAPISIGDDPKIVLHVIPFASFDLTQVISLSSLEKIARKLTPIFFSISNYRFNLDGYLWYGSNGYLQLFRNGIIEVVGVAASKDEMWIPALDHDCLLHEALPTYISAQKELGLSPPFLISLSLLGVRDCRIYVPPHWHQSPDQKIDRDVLLLPEMLIENFEFDLDKVLKQILDPFWNASGYQGSPHFDPNSEKWREISY
jgi:hypothetical protein